MAPPEKAIEAETPGERRGWPGGHGERDASVARNAAEAPDPASRAPPSAGPPFGTSGFDDGNQGRRGKDSAESVPDRAIATSPLHTVDATSPPSARHLGHPTRADNPRVGVARRRTVSAHGHFEFSAERTGTRERGRDDSRTDLQGIGIAGDGRASGGALERGQRSGQVQAQGAASREPEASIREGVDAGEEDESVRSWSLPDTERLRREKRATWEAMGDDSADHLAAWRNDDRETGTNSARSRVGSYDLDDGKVSG